MKDKMLTYWKYSINNYKGAIVFLVILMGTSIILGEILGASLFSIVLGALFIGSYSSWRRYKANYKRKHGN